MNIPNFWDGEFLHFIILCYWAFMIWVCSFLYSLSLIYKCIKVLSKKCYDHSYLCILYTALYFCNRKAKSTSLRKREINNEIASYKFVAKIKIWFDLRRRELFVALLLGGIYLCALPTCTYVSFFLYNTFTALGIEIIHNKWWNIIYILFFFSLAIINAFLIRSSLISWWQTYDLFRVVKI